MSIELAAEIELTADAHGITDGWRGLLDFGERWSEDDADLWAPEWGDLPIGEPLAYGCELRRTSADTRRVAIRLLAVDYLREVMKEGARFTLRDGHTARAFGRILSP